MLEDRIREVIEKDVRPSLQTHGGDCELIDVDEDRKVKIRLTGACAHCPSAQFTLEAMVKGVIKEKLPEIEDVLAISD